MKQMGSEERAEKTESSCEQSIRLLIKEKREKISQGMDTVQSDNVCCCFQGYVPGDISAPDGFEKNFLKNFTLVEDLSKIREMFNWDESWSEFTSYRRLYACNECGKYVLEQFYVNPHVFGADYYKDYFAVDSLEQAIGFCAQYEENDLAECFKGPRYGSHFTWV